MVGIVETQGVGLLLWMRLFLWQADAEGVALGCELDCMQ
jgi:hypothetical protein